MRAARAGAGFSLVEVLLIIAIIGLLLGVALPNQLRAAKQADENHCIANLEVIQAAIRDWKKANADVDKPLTLEMLQEHLHRKNLQCPSGGKYTLKSGPAPACSVAGHGMPGE